MPEGMTIVPPFPQEAIADVMAGTSSVEEDPPALGVHVEARAFSVLLASGRDRDRTRGSVVKKVKKWRRLGIVNGTSINCSLSFCSLDDRFITLKARSIWFDLYADPFSNDRGGRAAYRHETQSHAFV